MKTATKFFLYVFLFFACVNLSAQSQNQRNEILDELRRYVPRQGRVNVFEDESIKEILGRSMAPPRTVYSAGDGAHYVKMRGYRIQAFSGNNQRTSRNEAYSKQQIVSNSFPQYETVVMFDSPFWRLRVGNFKTREEADAVLGEMKKAFPSFGKEMYIVVDEVKIPVSQVE